MTEGQYILVYGAGISGCGVAKTLAARGEKVVLFNDTVKTIEEGLVQILEKAGGTYSCQTSFEEWLPRTKLVIVSPGITFENPLTEAARARGIEVIGEVEEASRLYSGHWIGITGTNGKTTTTTLVGEMLRSLPCQVRVGGNIGAALSSEVQGLSNQDWLVAELSSFQLEGVTSFRPDIALILNITPDHMERHHTMEKYTAAKANIFAHQKAEDILILNYDNKLTKSLASQAHSQICFISRKEILSQGIFLENGKFVIKWNGIRQEVCAVSDMQIFGTHNEENALGAIACAFFAGVDIKVMQQVLRSFQGVEHRLEYVTTIHGVPYYNDSKATNPDSTIKALESFPGHVVLLAGGHDKLTDLTEMMELIRIKTDALILLGAAQQRFYQAALKAQIQNIYLVTTFQEAVEKAYELAHEPQVVVLSPACSSYDMFDNFPQRGRVFKELVRKLPQ